jgi:hypothetical protein
MPSHISCPRIAPHPLGPRDPQNRHALLEKRQLILGNRVLASGARRRIEFAFRTSKFRKQTLESASVRLKGRDGTTTLLRDWECADDATAIGVSCADGLASQIATE